MFLPKALAFDVFGTVVDWRSGIAREAALPGQTR
jgi:2-haloacid dehalogenase